MSFILVSNLKFEITWNFAQLNPGILTLLEHFEDSKFDVFPKVAKHMREDLEKNPARSEFI